MSDMSLASRHKIGAAAAEKGKEEEEEGRTRMLQDRLDLPNRHRIGLRNLLLSYKPPVGGVVDDEQQVGGGVVAAAAGGISHLPVSALSLRNSLVSRGKYCGAAGKGKDENRRSDLRSLETMIQDRQRRLDRQNRIRIDSQNRHKPIQTAAPFLEEEDSTG